jgi:hypothetical protein
MRRLTHLVVLVAFIFSCGGEWAVIQCLAWGNMIRQYSEMVPVSRAIEMTFSGQYPCPICKALAEKKNTEQQKLLEIDKKPVKFLSIALASRVTFFPSPCAWEDAAQEATQRPLQPPSPPPRTIIG